MYLMTDSKNLSGSINSKFRHGTPKVLERHKGKNKKIAEVMSIIVTRGFVCFHTVYFQVIDDSPDSERKGSIAKVPPFPGPPPVKLPRIPPTPPPP